MKNKNYYDSPGESFDNKDYNTGKNVLNKFDYDLFDEEKNVVEKIIRVKRTQMPNKGERWRILQDTKTLFTVDGNKISKKEREFLKSSDGFSFLLSQAKNGIKSLNALRKEMKKKLDG